MDQLTEKIDQTDKDVEDTPIFGIKLKTDYILGMAKIDESVKILLDIDRVLNAEEMAELAKAA